MLLGEKSPEQTVIQGLVARGVPIHIAQGMTANMIAESNLNPGINEIAPVVPGSRGGWGLNQWTGPRRKAFEAFAAERGASLDDLNTQLDFTMYELGGPEAKAWAAIQTAKDPVEAAKLYSETFLRPGVPHMDKRLSEAARIAGMPMNNVTASTSGGATQGGLLAGAPMPPAEEKKRGLLGFLSDPDKRAQLAIALEGMTLNPNTALMGMLGEGVKDRKATKKTTESTNKTVAWLRSIGQGQLADALETGVVDPGAVVGQALQAMQPKEPTKLDTFTAADGSVYTLDPYTGQKVLLTEGKAPEPVTPMSTVGKLEADYRAGLISEDAYIAGLEALAPAGTRIVSDGKGGVTIEQGVKGSGGLTTEGALASKGYLQRMEKAETIFDTLSNEGQVVIPWHKAIVMDTDLEGAVLNDQESRLAQAQRDWVRAKLRKESGAVIGPEEMAAEIRTYFPQPGEGPDVVAQKKASRKAAEEQLAITGGVEAAPAAPAAGNDIGLTDDDLKYLGAP